MMFLTVHIHVHLVIPIVLILTFCLLNHNLVYESGALYADTIDWLILLVRCVLAVRAEGNSVKHLIVVISMAL